MENISKYCTSYGHTRLTPNLLKVMTHTHILCKGTRSQRVRCAIVDFKCAFPPPPLPQTAMCIVREESVRGVSSPYFFC